ncbi:unnamed protein product [Rotaria sp. Silwood1]|nr:unnamed protein product [Rotaria sp. Silwood1]CAF0933486.1 unnamed protein product [Rotaria sp. Silwood1]CAF3369868.1 unnamed protein product [Rotaria sp. Silwood1]CAF3428535.1 unnamed protein product [Rotaria sp. Silwood1]CAF4703986.1 unnamed protein product [Rotaria sp. Silwood1]
MQFNQIPLVPVVPQIQRDPAAVRFGIFFLSALAILTIGTGIGIGVGNLSHYYYYPPNNQTNVDYTFLYNLTFRQLPTRTAKFVTL